MARKLSEIENKDEILRELRAELAKAAAEYLRAARALSKARQDAARKLEKLVEAEINDLAMKSKFRIEMTTVGARRELDRRRESIRWST